MVRSAAAVLALLLIPAPTLAQEVEPRTHTVTVGNTLWNLAQAYYDDAYEWTRIFEANRDRLQDPDLLEPGVVLRIPGEPKGVVRTVTVETTVASAGFASSTDGRAPRAFRRTVFYAESPELETRFAAPDATLAVSEDDFYRAPWIAPRGSEPPRLGTLAGLAEADDPRRSARPRDRVRIAWDGTPPTVGVRLQAFRVDRRVERAGRVILPTGTLTVTEVGPGAVVARVDGIYGRMAPGDMVRPLPDFPLTPRMTGRSVRSGPRTTVVGFAGAGSIQNVGNFVFLDGGSDGGIRVGDVFEVVWNDLDADEDPGGGSVRVVAVQDGFATARITALENPVFETGVVLRLSRRMQ